MKLLAAPVALHDVRDVESLCRRVLSRRLEAWGAWLRPEEYDDALSYLVSTCWELSRGYDPTKGLSFSTYATRTLALRVVDWYRDRFGDSRYGGSKPALSLDLLAESLDLPVEDLLERQEDLSEEVLTRVAVAG